MSSSRKITNAHRNASLARFEVHGIGRGWLLRRPYRCKNSLLCDAGCSYRIPILHFIVLLLVYLSRVTTVYQVGTQRRSLVRALCRCNLHIGEQAPWLRSSSKDHLMKNLSLDPILNDRLLQGLVGSYVTSCSRKGLADAAVCVLRFLV